MNYILNLNRVKSKFTGEVHTQAGKRERVRFTLTEAQASQRRKRSTENKHVAGNLRAAVESTVHSVKLPFPEAQLPVRGKFRVTCMMIGSAVVANVRRIQHYLQTKSQEEMKQKIIQSSQNCAPDTLALSFFGVCGNFSHIGLVQSWFFSQFWLFKK